jgi:hypothetical protein
MKGRAISSGAILGTCAPPAAGWAPLLPNRPKDRQSIQPKCPRPTSPARCIARRGGRIARCSNRYGAPSVRDQLACEHRGYLQSAGPPSADDLRPVHLSAADRGRAAATFDQMAQSITVYEASHEVTAFSSKYDAVPAGKARSSRRKSRRDMTCFEAKRNATSVDDGPGEDPLFTDFTARNIGTPANPQLPYYAEGEPDARGYVANKSGASFIELGVGGFLPNGHPLSLPQSIRGGERWSRRIADAFRCPRCAMSTSGRALTL